MNEYQVCLKKLMEKGYDLNGVALLSNMRMGTLLKIEKGKRPSRFVANKLDRLFIEKELIKWFSFAITIMYGKCDGGESELNFLVTIDQYIVLSIAKENGIDFDGLEELEETLRNLDEISYRDERVLSFDRNKIRLEDIKSIDFENLNLNSVSDDVYCLAYDNEKSSQHKFYPEDDSEFDSFDIRVHI